jgi:hypothetical protein
MASEDPPRRPGAERWKLPPWLVTAIVSAFAFVVGLAIPSIRAQRLESRLEATTRALALSQLENALGAAALEARRGRYEPARQHASSFFTGLQVAIPRLPAATRGQVNDILARRDTTITVLSRSAPVSVELLDDLLARYREVARAGGATAARAAPVSDG